MDADRDVFDFCEGRYVMPRIQARGSQIIAYHLCWTAYGTWLPNDPHGSGSHTVASATLQGLGELHYGRRRVQPRRDVLRSFYAAANDRLKFEVIRFVPRQIEVVATGFARWWRSSGTLVTLARS
jgi:hypothetical protein